MMSTQSSGTGVPTLKPTTPMAPEPPSDELTLDDIISERPPTKVVREFMRAQLASILSEEEELFQ